MAGVGGNVFAYLKDSNSLDLNAVAKTATFDSEWIDIGAADTFGFIIIATVTGTSPTLDIDVECSHDNGTTAAGDYPAFLNVEAGDSAESGIASAGIAEFAQITATGNTMKFFKSFFPEGSSSGLNARVRLEFTIGGTNPSFTLTVIKVLKNPNTIF